MFGRPTEKKPMSQTLDPTFYRTPGEAIAAPPERLAYVAAFDPAGQAKDAMAVLDCDPASSTYGKVVGWSELPTAGNELHHFGWNACSSALCHHGHGGHGQPLERRYLIVPGIRSSRTYILDTKPDPRQPRVVREITANELAAKAGYSRPHTVHCGPGGIYLFALGGANGNDGPGGIALLDHDTFDVIGPWELDRGDQSFGYDGWWHLQHDTVITSEWGTPSMIEHGLDPEDLLGRRFGHHLNFWSMSQRTLTQRVDLGDAHQLVFEVRPAHDPAKAWGFVGVVISVEDLSGSVWLWHRDGERWAGWSPTHGSSPTGRLSADCGSTRPGSRPGMPPATPTATPADMHPIVAHHAGEQALAPLLLLASGGVPLLLAMTRERLAAVRQWLARSRDRGAS
jgi:selenium-binding protein 1